MIIQVYAFTSIDQAQQAARFGVDHIGFVAGNYGLVHGELSFEAARRTVAALRGLARAVALTMALEVDEILRMAEAVEPDVIHISTDPEAVDFAAMEQIKKRLPPKIKIMKAIPVEGKETLDLAVKFAVVSDYLLLDTKIHGMPGVGATGATHDWNISRQIVEAVKIPVILAGGLTPENVGEAIHIVAPAGVDSNTATNRPGSPVEKDMDRVRRFVEAARLESMDEKAEDRDGCGQP